VISINGLSALTARHNDEYALARDQHPPSGR
jgi:hypothetical protein